jgi:23S rRNA pseudouridine1911/1915/1917 synthase
MRLDVCLQKHLQTPRNQVEQLIKTHGVLVDGREVFKTGLKLKGGESIEYEIPQAQHKEPQKIDFDIEILYEDEDLLIINKPPHLVVHPAPSVKEPTLVDWLKHRGISLSTLSGEERHGIVHRIDKETSGALVVAKNNEAHTALSKQLEDKSMGRYYLAIIDIPLKEHLIVEKAIARHQNHRTKMALSDSGKDAKSAFVKLTTSQKTNHELIACKLFSGRTHQIRVHLESLSRHILNDETYGYKSKKEKSSRVMLHAYIIYFKHPKTGKLIVKTAPLFEDFKGILRDEFNTESIDEKTNPDTIMDSFTTCF